MKIHCVFIAFQAENSLKMGLKSGHKNNLILQLWIKQRNEIV